MKPGNAFTEKFFIRSDSRIILTGLVMALALAACGISPGATPTTGGSSSTDARAALLRAINASLTAGPYRVVAAITTGASSIAMHGEVILPDRFHVFSSVSGGPEREYIIMGSTTYAKVGSRWSAVQLDLSALLDNFVNRVDPSTISNVRLVGREDVNGAPALAYTYVYTNNISGTEITNNDKMWVDAARGLPVKTVVDGSLNDSVYHSEQSIEYDSSITIETPPTT